MPLSVVFFIQKLGKNIYYFKLCIVMFGDWPSLYYAYLIIQGCIFFIRNERKKNLFKNWIFFTIPFLNFFIFSATILEIHCLTHYTVYTPEFISYFII